MSTVDWGQTVFQNVPNGAVNGYELGTEYTAPANVINAKSMTLGVSTAGLKKGVIWLQSDKSVVGVTDPFSGTGVVTANFSTPPTITPGVVYIIGIVMGDSSMWTGYASGGSTIHYFAGGNYASPIPIVYSASGDFSIDAFVTSDLAGPDVITVTDSTAVSETTALTLANPILTRAVTDSTAVTDTVVLSVGLNGPDITIRSAISPYGTLSSLSYVQSALGGNNLPVLQGEVSNVLAFRVYNNFTRMINIATAQNVHLQVFDGVNTHTSTKSPVNQSWMRVYETGFGESAGTPGNLTQYLGQDTAIGGVNGIDTYAPEVGSDGTANARIRAGTNNAGVGFIEFGSYIEMPDAVGMNAYTFALIVNYEWTP